MAGEDKRGGGWGGRRTKRGGNSSLRASRPMLLVETRDGWWVGGGEASGPSTFHSMTVVSRTEKVRRCGSRGGGRRNPRLKRNKRGGSWRVHHRATRGAPESQRCRGVFPQSHLWLPLPGIPLPASLSWQTPSKTNLHLRIRASISGNTGIRTKPAPLTSRGQAPFPMAGPQAPPSC